MAQKSDWRGLFAVVLLVIASVMSLAATDLILPAVPELPEALGGSLSQAQLVLAAFALGNGCGLLLFGHLGARYDQRLIFERSLLVFAALSLLATQAPNLSTLIGLRFFQGLSAAAAPVFAPGMIRVLFSPQGALRAIGMLGSLASLAPALAPVLGVWILAAFGWSGSFAVVGLIAVVLALCARGLHGVFPELVAEAAAGSYLRLLRNPVYLRYALSQAFNLGGLLVFVFGAPTVITRSMGGSIYDFIIMQITGISSFIIAANLAARLAERFGPERVIVLGTLLSAVGAGSIAGYGVLGGSSTLILTLLFLPMNLGLGFRGPPGFYRAVLAAEGDDARGSALLLVSVLLIAASGTAFVAPWIVQGLKPLSLTAAALVGSAVIILQVLPRLAESATTDVADVEQD
ncbi:MAG: MFS transporter [Pseudomonadota bacterium]